MDQELDSDSDGLVDVIELVYEFNRFDPDTDGDGVTDYTEFCITCTDPLVPDGDTDTDGDGLTNAEEAIYGTNPDDLDTDNDNLGDYEEIMILCTDPLAKNVVADKAPSNTIPALLPAVQIDPNAANGTLAVDPPTEEDFGPGDGGSSGTAYSGTLYTKYDGKSYTSSVSYVMNFDYFFGNNTLYRPELAKVSSLLSAIAYDDNKLNITGGGTMTATYANAVYDWMDFYGFSHPTSSYDLHDDYSDQHVSEMFVGHKPVTYNGTTKNIICIVIRGTNGTLDEWQSNFDLGSTADFGNVTNWINPNNHMGFDITANRLNDELISYMSANGLTSSNSVLWITGHSRGAALANTLAAKRCETGYTVFAYTFATPATTTSTAAKSTTYQGIFNIINTDDLVPELPMSVWEFTRYGEDKPGSIEDVYAGEWDALVSGSETYTSNKTSMMNVVEKLGAIADTRNECYVNNATGYLAYSGYYTELAAKTAAEAQIKGYPENTRQYCSWVYSNSAEYYGYALYQKPAFFMQLLAAQMSNIITPTEFLTTQVAPYLNSAKNALIGLAGLNYDPDSQTWWNNYTLHPHYCESYYLLATKLS